MENKEKNNIIKEENIIKANILDFSLEQIKESYYNNYIKNMHSNYKNKNYFHYNKDYQESFGDINLSFSNEDINTFKYKENTIEAVFNEFNNINTLNNDSEIKVTFGQENINNNINYNNSEISTEGRIINDSFKNRKFSLFPFKIYKKEEILENFKIKEKISSVIIHDNEEENEDIKINFEANKEIDNDKNDDLILDFKNNEEENLELKNIKKDDDNNLNINIMENIELKNRIDSKDVINFAEKLGNIFGKKINSNDNKKKNYNDKNIFTSNFSIYDKDYKIQILKNEDFINILDPKCRTYSTNTNKYYEILNHYDLTALNNLEFRMNNEKNDFKHILNTNNNSINEIDISENENNITFNQNKSNRSQEKVIPKEINQNKIDIEKEIIYLLNIISINNFKDIVKQLLEIITNKNDINDKNKYIENTYIFADIIIRKYISELKYSSLYAVLCQNLNWKSPREENNDKNFKNIINISLKKKFEESLNNKNYSNKEFKHKMMEIINFIIGLIDSKMNNIENGFDYLNILYNKYLNDSNKDNKYLFLESIFILLDKFGKIIYIRKDLKNIQELNIFIDEKIKILFENENTLNFPEYIFIEITNLINTRDSEWKFNIYEEYQFNKYKNLILNNDDYNIEKNTNEYLDINNKIKQSNNLMDYYYLNNINYQILLIIKESIINHIYNVNSEDLYNNLFLNYKIEIYEIIQYYIEVCIDYVNNIFLIDNCNNYINKIIENYSAKENKDKIPNNKIADLILNIDYIIMDNKNMYQIMGYLLYSLINYELYEIGNFNKFIDKEVTTLTNIAIIIKYIILYYNKDYMGKDYKTKILEEFKQTELFKSNIELFDKYVINGFLL